MSACRIYMDIHPLFAYHSLLHSHQALTKRVASPNKPL